MWNTYWHTSPIDACQVILAFDIYMAFEGIFADVTYFAVVW